MGKHKKRRRSPSSSSSEESGRAIRHHIKRLRSIMARRERHRTRDQIGAHNEGHDPCNTPHIVPDDEAEDDPSPDQNILQSNQANVPDNTSVAPLDAETLRILGDQGNPPQQVDHMNPNIVPIWSQILQSGLPEPARLEILSRYKPLPNCPLMEAPKLNPEVKKCVSEAVLSRDMRLMGMQNRICSALSALAGCLNLLLGGDQSEETIRMLLERCSDSARLLADIHFDQSQIRRSVLKGSLNKDIATTLTEVSVDGWLFGADLSERLKTAKALDRASSDLKAKPAPATRPITTASSNYHGPPRSTSAPARQGGPKNWKSQRQPFRRYDRDNAPKKSNAQAKATQPRYQSHSSKENAPRK